MKRTVLGLLILAGGVTCMAWGQNQPEQEEGPGREVARISLINGEVSVRRGDSGEVVAAALNAPLVAEDQLLTGPGARAEVQFDWANMVRLAPLSEVHLSELENQRYQIQVARGMVTFRVLRESNAQIEIRTPTVSVRPVQQGTYRIAVRDDGTTQITVRGGEAEIFTPRGSERLPAGRTMLARGTASDPEFQILQAVAQDDWDRWNDNRDRQLAQSRSYNYVSRDIYGAEDLDSYGTWQQDPAYGDCWYPRVGYDWAPYRDGRWSWLDWYGWNWVSYDPWGWAPYHYGRWFYTANRGWGWWPGARFGRHYWSPGLVAFVGWDSWGGVRAGLGFGGIGWIPLAPYERYYPWYGNRRGIGPGLVNNFDLNSGYRNARVRGAVTGVDGRGFVSGRRGSAVQLGDGRLGSASLVRGSLPVTPGRSSTGFVNRQQAVRGSALSGNGSVGSQGWRRFGTGSGSSSPQNQRPGSSSPQGYRAGGQPQVRVNPPIVRERAPSYGGSGGSYSRPAPSSSGGGHSSGGSAGGAGHQGRSR